MSRKNLKIDRFQGIDHNGAKFGYIYTADQEDGGYFFTWLPTLGDTLDSLDADEMCRPTFRIQMARDFLSSKIADKF